MTRYALVSITLLTIASLVLGDEKADKAAQALKELQGDWQAIVVVQSGQDTPMEGISKMKVTIKDGTITFIQGEMKFAHKLKVDPSQSPMHFDIEAMEGPRKGKTVPGIYTIEKDILRVCHPNDPDQEDKRPKELKTKNGDGLSLLVLEKIK